MATALKRGIQEANVPFCAPMQQFHGLASRMAETGADYLFLPMIRSLPKINGEPFAVTVPARSLRELERLLAGRLVLERLLHVAEGVHVLQLDLRAERRLPARAQRDVRVAAEAPLLHVPVADAEVHEDVAQRDQVVARGGLADRAAGRAATNARHGLRRRLRERRGERHRRIQLQHRGHVRMVEL